MGHGQVGEGVAFVFLGIDGDELIPEEAGLFDDKAGVIAKLIFTVNLEINGNICAFRLRV